MIDGWRGGGEGEGTEIVERADCGVVATVW